MSRLDERGIGQETRPQQHNILSTSEDQVAERITSVLVSESSTDIGPGNTRKTSNGSKLFKHVRPNEPFTIANQLQRTLLNSCINILLLAAPSGITLHFTSVTPVAIFVTNFVAIIPLSASLSFAIEGVALRLGEALGGLLNVTCGNAVELIVSIMALLQGQIDIMQTTLIGSTLSNLLLVTGLCFFVPGLSREELVFNPTAAPTAASLLALAVAGIIVPTVFDLSSSTSLSDVAKPSRATSVILLVAYVACLFFQLKTHHSVYNEQIVAAPSPVTAAVGDLQLDIVGAGGLGDEEEDESVSPKLHPAVAVLLLVGSTVSHHHDLAC
ncbi:Sodium/calcium exchanger protein-domain-containing protein [Lasiosphaeria ovina]|uniref:Sodium/calcium exchanger protein-domain-containing protein n=1 Tax=Lasiosphaeria ovina TaxID=92902 RepID=A0AAE0MZY8_9PEZI|nr:Sodium/calcium exchanger protein-domain-containing protein [Lasiosphaeria ovina]